MRAPLWQQYPWLLGLSLAPFLHGAVSPPGQVLVAALFGVSLLLQRHTFGGRRVFTPLGHPLWRWLALACLFLPLVPLPAVWVEWLSPERAALARQFPLEPGLEPAWLTLTLSPASTVRRVWELGLILTAFWLARHATAQPGFPRQLAMVLGAVLLFLAASELWFRLDGRRLLLGLWPDRAGHGAGPFANRNHFAGWIYVAELFCIGWVLRNLAPLRTARLTPFVPSSRDRAEGLCLAAALCFGLVAAVSTGSRAGWLALMAGAAVWLLLRARRARRRGRWLRLAWLTAAIGVVIIWASGHVLNRLAEVNQDFPFKLAIWNESWKLFVKFPLFGTGWGAFGVAFNHFKSFGGEQSFLHAENELVQLLVETGLLGALVFSVVLGGLFAKTFRSVWREPLAEPELAFGALAAVSSFVVHGLLEFVFQVPANALLAAVVSGFVCGCRDNATRPALGPPPVGWRVSLNLCWAIALFMMAGLQGWAWLCWRQAQRAEARSAAVRPLAHSLSLWPWDAERQIAFVRAQVRMLDQPGGLFGERPGGPVARARHQLNRALRLDPFNWELRLERAWFELACSDDPARAQQIAWEAVRLNPLQPQIPLRFARHFAQRDADLALQLVRAAPLSSEVHLRSALELVWLIERDTASLWAITPDTTAGLLALGDFAVDQRLFPLAAQAYQRLGARVPPVALAEKYLRADRPDLAMGALEGAVVSDRARLVLSEACGRLGRDAEAIQHAEAVWMASPRRAEILSAGSTRSQSERPVRALNARDAASGREEAEALCRKPAPERDLERLRTLARDRPDDLRLLWLVFQTEREQFRLREAATTALNLARRVAGSPNASRKSSGIARAAAIPVPSEAR